MNNLQAKLDQLKWLKSSGVEYFCSTEKDSKNSLISELISNSSDKVEINEPKPVKSTNSVQSTKPLKSVIQNIMKETKTTNTPNSNILAARALADKAENLAQLKEYVENFEGCALKKFAANTVFADGVQDAKILLIGEAPGATEDEQGIPFCGESGKLLDKMLASIGICRTKNAYITNTIFWRPPANRRPTTEEIDICKPFVEKHIALMKPKLIILVGGTATASLLGKSEGISHIRKNSYSYTNQYISDPIHTTALFHPAYLLRQPMQKKTTWYDLLKIKDLLKKLGV
ncbi:MAG: uracil-DNA glycosylase [Rickettsiales bacterium]|nr:MAG: uracil-DNA glycosylase [Rickettsiales bacterium]